jgi:hypothetical protein
MKKILILFVALLLIGCSNPYEYPIDCDCGLVLSKGTAQLTSKICNWLEVKNECTGDINKLCIDNITTWELMNEGLTYCSK